MIQRREILSFWGSIHDPGVSQFGGVISSDVTPEQLSALQLKHGDCFIRSFYDSDLRKQLCYELCVVQHSDDPQQASLQLQRIPIDFSKNPLDMAGKMLPHLMAFHQLNFLSVDELHTKLGVCNNPFSNSKADGM